MNRKRAFFLLIFLPVLFTAGAAALVNYLSQFSLHAEQQAANAAQIRDLDVMVEAGKIAHDMLALQQEVSSTLRRAQAREIDEGQAYRIHAHVVDRLDSLEKQLRHSLTQVAEGGGERSETAEALHDFVAYRDHIIRATDIVAIAPGVADGYIVQAVEHYIAFTEHIQNIASFLTVQSRDRIKERESGLDRYVTRTLLVEWGGFLVLMAIWLVIARRLTRNLSAIADSLASLGQEKEDRASLAFVRMLAKGRQGGLFNELARNVLAFRRAISKRRESERKLFRYQNQLENLVTARTAELAAARDAAEAASRAKSTFLANISHEIRTPMNAIIGTTHLLRRESPSPQQVRQLDQVALAAQRLLGILNDILDYAKIESGGMLVERTDFDLDQLINDTLALVRDQALAKRLTLHVDHTQLPRHLHGDSTHLSQILLHYLSNAVKFTEHGGVRLYATLLREESGVLWVRFEVRDTGIGLDEADLDHLFKAFEQIDHGIDRQHGGTGLGLAISRCLAELMGGKVGVSSTKGHGSTFWLEAPFRPLQSPAEAAVEAETALGGDGSEKPLDAEEAAMQQLARIECLYLQEALPNFRGRSTRLRAMLIRFVEEHAADVAKIADLLNRGDAATALRLAHSLKGVSATLGLGALRTAAAELEASLKRDLPADEIQARLRVTAGELETTLHELSPLAKDEPSQQHGKQDGKQDGKQGPAALSPALVQHLEQLHALLAADDMESATLFEQIRDELTALAAADAARLGTLIDQFAFDEAVVRLGALRGRLGMR